MSFVVYLWCRRAQTEPPWFASSELTPGQLADFFALLAERHRATTRDGKPFYTCRFRDARRTVSFMVWADGAWYEACETRLAARASSTRSARTYGEHERYGPQIDDRTTSAPSPTPTAPTASTPPSSSSTRATTAEAMFAELQGLAETHIADEPLRRLVLTLLDRHAEALKRLPATAAQLLPVRRRPAGTHAVGDAHLPVTWRRNTPPTTRS